MIEEGLAAVRHLKARYPQQRVLADLKIMDAGEHEAQLAFSAGADIVTVLGLAADSTVSAPHNHCGQLVLVLSLECVET